MKVVLNYTILRIKCGPLFYGYEIENANAYQQAKLSQIVQQICESLATKTWLLCVCVCPPRKKIIFFSIFLLKREKINIIKNDKKIMYNYQKIRKLSACVCQPTGTRSNTPSNNRGHLFVINRGNRVGRDYPFFLEPKGSYGIKKIPQY